MTHHNTFNQWFQAPTLVFRARDPPLEKDADTGGSAILKTGIEPLLLLIILY